MLNGRPQRDREAQGAALVLQMYLRIRRHQPDLPPREALDLARKLIVSDTAYDDGTIDDEFEELRSAEDERMYREVKIAVGAGLSVNAIYDSVVWALEKLFSIPLCQIDGPNARVEELGIRYNPSDGTEAHQASILIDTKRLLQELPLVIEGFDARGLMARSLRYGGTHEERRALRVLSDLVENREVTLPL